MVFAVAVTQPAVEADAVSNDIDLYRSFAAVSTHPRVDPTRIAVMGFSRGAFGARRSVHAQHILRLQKRSVLLSKRNASETGSVLHKGYCHGPAGQNYNRNQ
jgi:hypothetical protein